jgi:hypothetical protein
MENNKCVLVKINEYYDLLRKSEENKLDSKMCKITQIAKELAIEDIKNLPWHKRLFFNEKYIK